MASSEVEISSPFGCVLRDHNRRQFFRDTNAKKTAAFQRNLKELVRERFHDRISVSSEENSNNNNLRNGNGAVFDSWLAKEQGNQSRRPRGNDIRLQKNRYDNENENNVNNKIRSSDDSAIISSKQSRIYDRWAAKQAQEMVSSIQKQSREAELLEVSSSTSHSGRENPEHSRNSNSNSNNSSFESGSSQLGASSLVQMWEARLNRSNSMNLNLNPVLTSSRTSSGLSNGENISSSCLEEESPWKGSEIGDSTDERPENRPNQEDWESQGRNSDAVESERVRVADIIKRLTSCNDDNDNEIGGDSPSRERRHSSVSDQAAMEPQREQRIGGFSQIVVSSPKIRGRQAFADLLMQMERERHRELESLGERQAVSRFAQRGRIQSMLRLRILQRGLAIQDQQRTQSSGSSMSRLSQGSTIMHLREKFDTCFDNGVTAQNDAASSRSTYTGKANNSVRSCNDSDIRGESQDNIGQEGSVSAGRQNASASESPVSRSSEDHHKESRPRMDVKEEGTSNKAAYFDSQETSETGIVSGCLGSRSNKCQEDNLTSSQGSSISITSVAGSRNEDKSNGEREANEPHQMFMSSQESIEMPELWNDWDENELAAEVEEDYEEQQQQFSDTNYDWISEISRPRSYWEDRRREWYDEMLTSSPNEEIRQLLERRRVSTFLASDFRDTMDELMASHVHRQTNANGYQEEHEEYSQERMGQMLLSFLQRHVQQTNSHQEQHEQVRVANHIEDEDEEEQEQEESDEEEEEEDEDDDEEEEQEEMQSPISHRFQEASDYFDRPSSLMQMPSPSLAQTWSFGDHEGGDDYDHPIPSTSSLQALPPHAYYQDSRQSSSSTARLSVEMELIYDLRGQMEQLQREMSELRKSLQDCMNVQEKPQHSFQQQAVHSGRGTTNHLLDGMPKKRNCCICYETQVDSLLYRCGHMCTCIKCAHELQWSSGKCPICRAPIVDVVRAYMDS